MIETRSRLMTHACLALSRVSPITKEPMICGVRDKDKPMIFRGTDWCSEWHRRMVIKQRRKARVRVVRTMKPRKRRGRR